MDQPHDHDHFSALLRLHAMNVTEVFMTSMHALPCLPLSGDENGDRATGGESVGDGGP